MIVECEVSSGGALVGVSGVLCCIYTHRSRFPLGDAQQLVARSRGLERNFYGGREVSISYSYERLRPAASFHCVVFELWHCPNMYTASLTDDSRVNSRVIINEHQHLPSLPSDPCRHSIPLLQASPSAAFRYPCFGRPYTTTAG